jgi:NAD(P)-dependent dehydrogenase (short-subunit alcohol dehydrogenase family)
VTKEETLAAAMEAARARWGRIDILHNMPKPPPRLWVSKFSAA